MADNTLAQSSPYTRKRETATRMTNDNSATDVPRPSTSVFGPGNQNLDTAFTKVLKSSTGFHFSDFRGKIVSNWFLTHV